MKTQKQKLVMWDELIRKYHNKPLVVKLWDELKRKYHNKPLVVKLWDELKRKYHNKPLDLQKIQKINQRGVKAVL